MNKLIGPHVATAGEEEEEEEVVEEEEEVPEGGRKKCLCVCLFFAWGVNTTRRISGEKREREKECSRSTKTEMD